MSVPDTLDQLVGELLAALYTAGAVGPLGMRAAAERDARYAALTGSRPAPPREIVVALGFARVAAEYRRRYGVPHPADDTAAVATAPR